MSRVTNDKLDESWLQDVPADKVFWCHDGRVMRNIRELAAAFNDMSEDTFRYHANKEKNDFSNWVRDVIGDAILAGELKKAVTRNTAARKADKRLQSREANTKRVSK